METTFIRFLFITALVFTTFKVNSQVLFSETFNEGAGSTSGTDETGGISWTSSCGGCISGDIWEEKDGEFHNNDSNGPATITTNTIDITSCSSFVIEFDYNNVGTFEDCGSGCDAVDWISLEYTIDGTTYSPTNSYFCSGNCANLNVIWDGAEGNNGTYISDPISTGGGSNLEFEIGSQTWAGTEYINIDNITATCLVPLSSTNLVLNASKSENTTKLVWKTDIENTKYSIERSEDGKNFVLLGETNTNEFVDYNPKMKNYYRIIVYGETDKTYSNIEKVDFENKNIVENIYPNPAQEYLMIDLAKEGDFQLTLYAIDGKEIIKETISNTYRLELSGVQKGIYFLSVNNSMDSYFTKVVVK